MGFGTDLQGKASHEALLRVQDAEIRLLENMKQCFNRRIKSDRDYALSLYGVIQQAQRIENSEFTTPMFQGWTSVIKQTENYMNLVKSNTDQLTSATLEKLQQLIDNKRAQRKLYGEERHRLETDNERLITEVEKNKTEYQRVLEKVNLDKTRYEDLLMRGKPGTKFDESKHRYLKNTAKLHKIHNSYVLSVKETNLHQKNYLDTILPSLLNSHQVLQELMVSQCKEVLEDYVKLTDTTGEDFVKTTRESLKAAKLIDPKSEYSEFQETYKTSQIQPLVVEFDKDLLEDYKGNLRVGEIALDDLTVEALQNQVSVLEGKLETCVKDIEGKTHNVAALEEELKELKVDEHSHTCNHVQKKSLELYKKEVTELECHKNKYTSLLEELYSKVKDVDKNSLKRGLEIIDHTEPTSPEKSDTASLSSESSTESAPRSLKRFNLRASVRNLHFRIQEAVGTGGPSRQQHQRTRMDSSPNIGASSPTSPTGTTTFAEFRKKLNTLAVKNPFKKTSVTPPTPPSKTVLESRSSLVTEDEMNGTSEMDLSTTSLPAAAAASTPNKSSSTSSAAKLPSSSSYQEVDLPASSVAMSTSSAKRLEDEEWFHGILPREEVQRLLREQGDYLVRESKNRKTGEKQYVMSVMWQGHKHFIIQGSEDQWRFEGPNFKTIQELVVHQHKSGLPVTAKSQTILKTAILKEDWELNNDDIELGAKIGNGNFGDVFKGVYKKKKMDVAVKTCRETLSDEQKKKFLQEGNILKQYDHPNIVKLIGIGVSKNPVMIVMEYVPGGSLLNFLRKQGKTQSAKQLIKMCEDASAGMAYLESNNCIHRDLAARNCLVGKDSVVKISDFGMSREEEEYTVSDGLKQIPIKWTAPEALNFGRYTSLCDVWSFGILMWEVFSGGATPYPGLTNTQAREKIDMGYRLPAPEGTPDAVHDIMEKCWQYEPENRCQFAEVFRELQKARNSV